MPGQVLLPFDIGAYSSPGSCILGSLTSSNPNPKWAVTAGDKLNLILAPRSNSGIQGAATTSAPLAAGSTIVVTGKLISNLDASSLLFEAINFTHSTDVNGNDLYTGFLNLDTDELAAAIPTGQQSAPVMLVIDILDASGNPQRYLCTITVFNETYSGSEGSPTPATPAFWTGSQIQAGVVNNWNFITDIGGSTSTSLNGQATAGVVAFGTQVALRGIAAVNGGGYTIWEYAQWTGGGTPPATANQQPPLDFNATSNVGYWIKVL